MSRSVARPHDCLVAVLGENRNLLLIAALVRVQKHLVVPPLFKDRIPHVQVAKLENWVLGNYALQLLQIVYVLVRVKKVRLGCLIRLTRYVLFERVLFLL